MLKWDIRNNLVFKKIMCFFAYSEWIKTFLIVFKDNFRMPLNTKLKYFTSYIKNATFKTHMKIFQSFAVFFICQLFKLLLTQHLFLFLFWSGGSCLVTNATKCCIKMSFAIFTIACVHLALWENYMMWFHVLI